MSYRLLLLSYNVILVSYKPNKLTPQKREKPHGSSLSSSFSEQCIRHQTEQVIGVVAECWLETDQRYVLIIFLD